MATCHLRDILGSYPRNFLFHILVDRDILTHGRHSTFHLTMGGTLNLLQTKVDYPFLSTKSQPFFDRGTVFLGTIINYGPKLKYRTCPDQRPSL
jgi:hypothetical protein